MSSPDQSKGVSKWSTPFERDRDDDWECAYWLSGGTPLGVKRLRADRQWYVVKFAEGAISGPVATLEAAQAAAEMMAEMGMELRLKTFGVRNSHHGITTRITTRPLTSSRRKRCLCCEQGQPRSGTCPAHSRPGSLMTSGRSTPWRMPSTQPRCCTMLVSRLSRRTMMSKELSMRRLSDAERELGKMLHTDAYRRSSRVVAIVRGNKMRIPEYNIPRLRNWLTMIEDKYQGIKLRRKAYVCDGGQIRYCNDVGFGSITDAFIARPSTCRYCVFETVDSKALLVDMYELTQSGNPTALTIKEGGATNFDNVESAIMYAITIE